MNKNLKEKKIIIADDDEIYNMLLTKLLKSWKADVTSVFNGLELLEKLNENPYHLVIIDNNMPVMSGSEAIHKIRQDCAEPNKSIPIISLTASGTDEEKEEFLRLGSNLVLLKPIENDTLYNAVSNILELNLVQ